MQATRAKDAGPASCNDFRKGQDRCFDRGPCQPMHGVLQPLNRPHPAACSDTTHHLRKRPAQQPATHACRRLINEITPPVSVELPEPRTQRRNRNKAWRRRHCSPPAVRFSARDHCISTGRISCMVGTLGIPPVTTKRLRATCKGTIGGEHPHRHSRWRRLAVADM